MSANYSYTAYPGRPVVYKLTSPPDKVVMKALERHAKELEEDDDRMFSVTTDMSLRYSDDGYNRMIYEVVVDIEPIPSGVEA